jgi:hypothetical protein
LRRSRWQAAAYSLQCVRGQGNRGEIRHF